MKKIGLVIISLLVIVSSACSKPSPENSTSTDILDKRSTDGLAKLPEDAPSWVASCSQYPELCVPICQRSAKQCATQVNTFVTQKQPNGDYLFQSWSQFPNQTAFHANQGTPMHGSYLTIFVNDIAQAYLNSVLQKGNNQQLDYVDFPNGSLIVKQNFVSKLDNPKADHPWLTVMWKLDGYCHGNFGGAGPCIGGEWFYYLNRFGGFHDFDGQPAYGKAQAFCADCHGPVQKADFIWSLFDQLKKQQPATSTVPSEQASSTNVVNFCAGTPLDPTVPGDVAKDPMDVSPEQAQLMFDCLSWRSFVALNWPAKSGKRGVPDTSKNIGDTTSPRVWETYREIFEVFQPANPDWKLDQVSWDSEEHLDPVCNASSGNKVLRMTSKNRASPVLNETHQAFGNQFNILVDQNGNQLHYEVLINRDEFEFFKQNKYANTGNYATGGPLQQLSWQAKPLHFPDNIRGTEGAIEIKAAWRIMCTDSSCTTKDDPSRYYTRDVQIYQPLADGSASCTKATVGLVGMHIGHKTFWTPQWVWSTFEHLDNVPPAGQSGTAGVQYGLYSEVSNKNQPSNAECARQRPGALPPGKDPKVINCPNNQLICNSHPDQKNGISAGHCPAQLNQSLKQNTKANRLIPNQVTRIDKISNSTLNTSYPQALAAYQAPWTYYRLVNTQWPVKGRGDPVETTINMHLCEGNTRPPCYSIAPRGLKLRNTTMETFQVTYLNKTDHPDGQTSSAGCMQCHGMAGLDFSFAWTDAAEEIVTVVQDELSDPPSGSYRQTCSNLVMNGGTLSASCLNNNSLNKNSSALANAHLCSGDIANINGQLWCNPPIGSFQLTCSNIDLQGDTLSANCRTDIGGTKVSSLVLQGYQGVIENCNGRLTKGRCF